MEQLIITEIKPQFYYAQKKQNLQELKCLKKTDTSLLKIINNLQDSAITIEKNKILILPEVALKPYIVMPNDSLITIAEKFNISSETIRKINRLENIFVGQKIFIPNN